MLYDLICIVVAFLPVWALWHYFHYFSWFLVFACLCGVSILRDGDAGNEAGNISATLKRIEKKLDDKK